MEKFNNIIVFFKNITRVQIIDMIIAIFVILIFQLLSKALASIIVRVLQFSLKGTDSSKKHWVYKPLKAFFSLLGIYIGLYIIKLPDSIFSVINTVFKICIIVLTANALVNLFNNSSDFFARIRKRFNFKGNEVASSFISKIIASLIYIVAGFIVISELGYDLGGLATGLGISSVVIAFATQDLIKSLFSGFSIIYDRTFEIGDYIETKDFEGTVEDITFKTTRIRDLNDQIISIPNSMLINSYVINSSKIQTRRFSLKLTLELDTPLEKVNLLIDSIKLVLIRNENIIDDTVRVNFTSISDNGIDISIHSYSNISEFVPFLETKEALNYQILKVIEHHNISLAYPSQTIYLKKHN